MAVGRALHQFTVYQCASFLSSSRGVAIFVRDFVDSAAFANILQRTDGFNLQVKKIDKSINSVVVVDSDAFNDDRGKTRKCSHAPAAQVCVARACEIPQ